MTNAGQVRVVHDDRIALRSPSQGAEDACKRMAGCVVFDGAGLVEDGEDTVDVGGIGVPMVEPALAAGQKMASITESARGGANWAMGAAGERGGSSTSPIIGARSDTGVGTIIRSRNVLLIVGHGRDRTTAACTLQARDTRGNSAFQDDRQ